MTEIHGFVLEKETDIPEISSHVRMFRHVKTGAQLISLENDDENKCFTIAFPTPPEDSTGLPHIMEHSVLKGSRKYPLKQPFIHLSKGSLNTFLNAFTGPDRTMYPVASQNVKDFYNLVDVYMDSVFYPLIKPETLMEEGWHYELENLDDPLVYKGVVFNEMKGAYSSPEGTLYRRTLNALFPDNAYRHSSGGDPVVMPDLDYEQFKTFHETYYHPSNALIGFYGDDDPEERLRIVNDYLKDFDKRDVDSSIALQTPFDAPTRTVYQYDPGEDASKEMMTMSWLLPEPHDVELSFALGVLEHVLLGTPASPLRKALLESGLGEDIVGGGLSNTLRQMTFSVGMKGVAVGDTTKVENLIIDTLSALIKGGIDPATIEASLNTIEFQLRESNTGRFPRGLVMMMRGFGTWVHDGDPVAALAYEAPLNTVKEKFASGDKFLEQLIEEHLLNNIHRSTVVLEPDTVYRKNLDEAEKARLAKVREGLSERDLQDLIDVTKKLKIMQETPDSPEALATIPALSLTDIEREVKVVPIEVFEENGAEILYHDLATNGILYLDIGFNLQQLSQELLPYVNLFGKALLQMGTETEDFVQLSQRIGRKTGGIRFNTIVEQTFGGNDDVVAWFLLRGKSTIAQTDEMLVILHDVLIGVKFDNKSRFQQMVLEDKAGMESGLIPSGHMIVRERLSARFNTSDWANEQIEGVSYLFFLRELVKQIESDWDGVVEKLEAVRSHLLNRKAMICNVTVDNQGWESVRPELYEFISKLPAKDLQLSAWQPAYVSENEGLTIPAQVNYVGKGLNLYKHGYTYSGSIQVIQKYLRTGYLWEKVRVQGGAYGGFCVFSAVSGVFSFLSYRDPNLLGTLDNYDGVGDFIRALELSESELHKTIIGTIGDMDGYEFPDAKGYSSMVRYLIKLDDATRQKVRDEVLSTTVEDFKAFADVVDQVAKHGEIVVMGSKEAIEAANEKKPALLSVKRVL